MVKINLKWFLFGILVGFALAILVGAVLILVEPYHTIKQKCFENTANAEKYEECIHGTDGVKNYVRNSET